MKCLLIPLLFAGALMAQGTPYDCFSVYSFSGATPQTGQSNASSQSPCVAWRVTYTTTGFSSVTVAFQTSSDNSNWTDVTNSICSSSVQPPCVTDGANPLDAGVMGSASFRVYAKYVRVSVTSVTGSGTGQVVTYGYKGTSASAGLGSGGGGTGGSLAIGQEFGSTASGAQALTAETAYFFAPISCVISAWNMTVAPSGTATIDVWKVASGTSIPTISNTITASATPAIATGTALHSTDLAGWTTSVSTNDILAFSLITASTATFASLVLKCDQ